MSAHRKGSTHPGLLSALPDSRYDTNTIGASWLPGTRGLVVDFHGEVGRSARFDLTELPLAGWHEPLSIALDAWFGPSGSRRTFSSARSAWSSVKRLIHHLAQQPAVPAVPGELTAAHLESFHRHRLLGGTEFSAWSEIRHVGLLLEFSPLRQMVRPEVFDYVGQRVEGLPVPIKVGYSDGELRRLLAAARTDVTRLRTRMQRAESLTARWRDDPGSVVDDDRELVQVLAEITQTGDVPLRPDLNSRDRLVARRALAANLFVTLPDLLPMMVLFVALTGRSPETIKELPAEHRILEGRAVELRAVKRRRGPQHWHETVTWEIGPAGRELHFSGGLYLLSHALMRRSREFAESTGLLAIWRNGHRSRTYGDPRTLRPVPAAAQRRFGEPG